ncbi:MAG TPA: zinc-binding dehydrogenase [Solirubrobacteraceae bacterium]|nr:zinc-binding dehydrogenase [Solirubrobacteraceae bacterium]
MPVRLRSVDRPGCGDVYGAGYAREHLRGVRRGDGRTRRRGCRLQGAERIIAVDLSEDRLALARGQGATDTWGGGADTVQRVLEATGGFGADYTLEATGSVAVMRQAVEAARMAWGLCTVAGVAGAGETLDVIPRWPITGRRVAGPSFGGVKGRDQVPQLVQRYLDGDIDVDPFVSHHITLEEVNRGFELIEPRTGSAA